MRVPNLHTAPKRHLIKIRNFLRKIDSYLEKYKFARCFEWLRLDHFLEILKSNKTPNKFSTDQLKITFKHQNFVREPFQICSKIRIPLDLKHLNFRIFSFILHHKYPNNLF